MEATSNASVQSFFINRNLCSKNSVLIVAEIKHILFNLTLSFNSNIILINEVLRRKKIVLKIDFYWRTFVMADDSELAQGITRYKRV